MSANLATTFRPSPETRSPHFTVRRRRQGASSDTIHEYLLEAR